MADLTNATRRVLKTTYQNLSNVKVDTATGRAVPKFSFINSLALQVGEVAKVRTTMGTFAPLNDRAWSTLTAFEGAPLPALAPAPSALASIPTAALTAFGNELVALRKQALAEATTAAADPPDLAGERLKVVRTTTDSAALRLGVNTAVQAANNFEQAVTATPIGMLNLERLEMAPAGIERGDLISSIPLAPLETTTVVQKEWSIVSQEFTSIVTDSQENYSETGVTDKTDLSQATDSENQHSSQFNVNATVSGSSGFVTASLSTSANVAQEVKNSEKDSRDHSVTTTRKASSRSRQEHKTTISVSTITGTSETTVHHLQNPSKSNPMRIDYFNLMRKWHISLYRYGLRLTYDLGIPEPASAMRGAYAQLSKLQAQANGGFTFEVPHSEITTEVRAGENQPHYLMLADKYNAQVPPPPMPQAQLIVNKEFPTGGPVDIPFTLSDGWITGITISFKGENIDQGGGIDLHAFIYFSNFKLDGNNPLELDDFVLLDTQGNPYLEHQSGDQTVHVEFNWHTGSSAKCNVKLVVDVAPTDSQMATWQDQVWDALNNAAQTNYNARQQAINAQIAELQAQLDNTDTLTLRREENDEIMKGVLRWILGPTFAFMPQDVQDLFNQEIAVEATAAAAKAPDGPNALNLAIADLQYGIAFTSNDLSLDSTQWSTMFHYQEMIKFINEAIEWENVIYFLYSYFWDMPPAWDFIRTIQHPDATRQAFLRAGSARVVLPVRQGWEQAWVSFVETGGFSTALDADHPYMTIAQEIQDYDNTNYPGIPPANAGGAAASDGAAAACSVDIASGATVLVAVDSSSGFTVGAQAIIDTTASGIQETQVISAVPDETHITLQKVASDHNGSANPFPIVQAGEKGVLIADWYEYTPTSAVDIAVTSNLASMS